jgi:hypothetical protein
VDKIVKQCHDRLIGSGDFTYRAFISNFFPLAVSGTQLKSKVPIRDLDQKFFSGDCKCGNGSADSIIKLSAVVNQNTFSAITGENLCLSCQTALSEWKRCYSNGSQILETSDIPWRPASNFLH